MRDVGGRPPEKYSDAELPALGKDLLQWVDSAGKGEIFWIDWYYHKHGMFRSDWKALIQRALFLPYYELARQKLTHNMMKNKELHPSFINRYIHLRDDELRQAEKEIRLEEAQAKKGEEQAVDLSPLRVLLESVGKSQSAICKEALENRNKKSQSEDITQPSAPHPQ